MMTIIPLAFMKLTYEQHKATGSVYVLSVSRREAGHLPRFITGIVAISSLNEVQSFAVTDGELSEIERILLVDDAKHSSGKSFSPVMCHPHTPVNVLLDRDGLALDESDSSRGVYINTIDLDLRIIWFNGRQLIEHGAILDVVFERNGGWL